jgi:ribosomal protein L37AE/L43A
MVVIRIEKVRCPQCGKYDDVGRIGANKYFCSECCVEFSQDTKQIKVINLSSTGLASRTTIIEKK